MRKFGLSWVLTLTVDSFVHSNLEGVAVRNKAKPLWQDAIFAGLWCIWLTRNKRISMISRCLCMSYVRGFHFWHLFGLKLTVISMIILFWRSMAIGMPSFLESRSAI